MKCANETVTIELKNGTSIYPNRISLLGLLNSFPHLLISSRNDPSRHHHLRLPTNEHSLARRQDDSKGPGPYLARHNQYPWIDDSILHSSGLVTSRYAAYR